MTAAAETPVIRRFVVALTGHYSNPSSGDEPPTLQRLVRALLDSADDIAELVRRLRH